MNYIIHAIISIIWYDYWRKIYQIVGTGWNIVTNSILIVFVGFSEESNHKCQFVSICYLSLKLEAECEGDVAFYPCLSLECNCS